MKVKVKFKQLDKYQYADTYTLRVVRSIEIGEGHHKQEFNKILDIIQP